MTTFPTVFLRDVCQSVRYGYTASATTDQVGPRFLRITDIAGTHLDWRSVPFCEIEPRMMDRHRLRTGDIVVARTGATTGWAKYISDPPEAVFASYLVRLRPADSVDSRFIGFIVESQAYRDFVQQHMSGAAQPNANAQVLTSFPLPLPSLPLQRRIAGILSVYDDLIENDLRRIRILDEMARAIYREWFVHFRFSGYENVPLVATPTGPLPDGWVVRRLGDIAQQVRHNVGRGSLEEPMPYVGLEHIPRRSLALDAWDMTADLGSNKLEFKQGDVLFGKIRPYFHKVSVAPFDGLCSADTIVIRAKRSEYRALVTACVSSDDFVAQATTTSNGSKMPRANWDVLQNYHVAIPCGEPAARFARLMDDVIAQQRTLVFRNINIRLTRDLLLPRLLSGQLSIDEAA